MYKKFDNIRGKCANSYAYGNSRFQTEFKTKIAIAAIKGEETTNQIASSFGIHPAQVRQWNRQMLDNAPAVFEKSRK